jgi:uncharacterized protein YkwD
MTLPRVFLVAVLLVLATACVTWTPAPPQNEWLAATNQVRTQAGVPAIPWDTELERMAQDWANWLCANGGFYHRALAATLHSYGGAWERLGEVMVKGPIATFDWAMYFWQRSPSHYSTVVDPRFALMGGGHAVCPGGQDIWVANFGKRF